MNRILHVNNDSVVFPLFCRYFVRDSVDLSTADYFSELGHDVFTELLQQKQQPYSKTTACTLILNMKKIVCGKIRQAFERPGERGGA